MKFIEQSLPMIPVSSEAAGSAALESSRRGPFWGTFVAGFLWLSVMVAAMVAIFIYADTPSHATPGPVNWPAQSQIGAAPTQPTLVMFVHPHCPCTRASLGELEQLMTDCQGRLVAQVWFVKPAGVGTDWTNTDLWATAARIPGVTVHCDENGLEAQRFHAETSGETLLYDPAGHLLFQGGITIARGHFGDNSSLSQLENRVDDKSSTFVKTPVFGCALFDSECQQTQTQTGSK